MGTDAYKKLLLLITVLDCYQGGQLDWVASGLYCTLVGRYARSTANVPPGTLRTWKWSPTRKNVIFDELFKNKNTLF